MKAGCQPQLYQRVPQYELIHQEPGETADQEKIALLLKTKNRIPGKGTGQGKTDISFYKNDFTAKGNAIALLGGF
jgi:hypothetical protein